MEPSENVESHTAFSHVLLPQHLQAAFPPDRVYRVGRSRQRSRGGVRSRIEPAGARLRFPGRRARFAGLSRGLPRSRRSQSGWLAEPDDYALPQYSVDMAVLLARLDVDRVDRVGTSLGGLIGMVLAGLPDSPIRRLVINDSGPFVPAAALRRIGDYLRTAPADFPDFISA